MKFPVMQLIVGICLPVLSACQTTSPQQNLTLEEAKQLTASFERPIYTPPLRSIDDVVAGIRSQIHIIKFLSPADCTEEREEKFLRDSRLRVKSFSSAPLSEAISTIPTSLELGPSFGRQDFFASEQKLLYDSGYLEESNAVILDLLSQTNERYWTVTHSGWRSALAVRYASVGDFSNANSSLKRAKRALTQARLDNPNRNIEDTRDFMNLHEAMADAEIAQLGGTYAVAEGYFRKALGFSGTIQGAWGIELGLIRSRLARNLSLQGELMEAEVEAREALKSSDRASRAASLVTFADILFEQGRYRESEQVSAATMHMFDSYCMPRDSLQYSFARVANAKALSAQGQWVEASVQFDRLASDIGVSSPQIYLRRFAGDIDMGLAFLKTGRIQDGLQAMELAYAQARERLGEAHYETAMALGFAGLAQLATDDLESARASFLGSVPRLIAGRQQAASASRSTTSRVRRLGSVLEAYMQLLERSRDSARTNAFPNGVVDEMFKLADVARSGSVERAMAAASARAVADPVLATLVRQEQDAKQQVEALQVLALSLRSHGKPESNLEIQDVQVRLERARSARQTLLAEIQNQFPDYADRVNPKAGSVTDARQALQQNEVLISIYAAETQTYVWAVPKTGPIAFTVAPLNRKALSEIVRSLRLALDPSAETLGEIPAFDVKQAHSLFTSLLAPIQAVWSAADTLVVVAHDALGQLPLGVLPTEAVTLEPEQAPLFSRYRAVPWLSRSHAIAVAPSVATFREQRSAGVERMASKSFIGFGDPWFREPEEAAEVLVSADLTNRVGVELRGLSINLRASLETRAVSSAGLSDLPRLPETAGEVRSIARALGADLQRDVFLGPAANEQNVYKQPLEQYRVLAFATHGLIPGDLNGLLQPALALSSPEVAQVQGDGLLTLEEVLSLKLNADWVVLSACNTASADGAGAEAVSGLGRAFFYAGARSLLVTHWPVETNSAKALTTGIFREQIANPSLSRAGALRQSKLNLIDGPGHVDSTTGLSIFTYAHPIFWAPFALVGDGGGKRS